MYPVPRSIPAVLLAGLVLAGCGGDRPTAPGVPEPPPDLAQAAFQLTIDVGTGRVEVASPGRPSGAGLSYSLLAADAVSLATTPCVFSAIPLNKKQVRCTFQLAVANKLESGDLVTPTVPAPPAGTNGIVVFPFTAAAQSANGSSAVANADWDNPPRNFFNDFSGCGGGAASDCYRSETYPGPLLAGESTPLRTVGFDVDKAAQRVSVYVLVAADLGRRISLASTPERCGNVASEQSTVHFVPSMDFSPVAGATATGYLVRGFCSFDLSPIPAHAKVVAAVLRLHQELVQGAPYSSQGNVVLDHMDLGPIVDGDDFGAAGLEDGIALLSTTPEVEWKTADVTAALSEDLAAFRTRADFRVRFSAEALTGNTDNVFFDRPSGTNPPELVVLLPN
jgi:hypothetical protein